MVYMAKRQRWIELEKRWLEDLELFPPKLGEELILLRSVFGYTYKEGMN